MTIYRRNPLLMTVMGANPGPRARRREDPIDKWIAAAWHRLMSGVQVPMLDIPRIFRDVKLEVAGGMSIEEAVMRVGQRYQVNRNPRYRRNPSLAASLAGGLAGAFVTHAMSNPGPAFIVIDSASGVVQFRRAASGMGTQALNACLERAQDMADKLGRSFLVFLDMQSFKVGARLALPMVRMMGATEVFPGGGVGPASNPLNEAEHRRIMREARHEAGVADVYRDRGELITEGVYRGRVARAKEIAHNFSPRSNPRKSSTKKIRRANPQANPGPKGSRRKITMTVQQFAAWVKKKRDPAMWRAFLAKFRGYEKWTHGAKSRKVTLEWQNVPGMDGLWITYDGGKQPESTYIMPKGSPRKGAWKHPWDTMPDIKHDAEAGLVLTKLRGKSKITDFYHR